MTTTKDAHSLYTTTSVYETGQIMLEILSPGSKHDFNTHSFGMKYKKCQGCTNRNPFIVHNL